MARRSNTISDVARDAGLSIKTVSRVLNGEPFVREDTKRAVLASVERLNYQRNAYARGLRAARSNVWALFYEDPLGGYQADILHGVLMECKAEGMHLIVELLNGADLESQLDRFLAQVRLDGAVLTPPHCDDRALLAIFAQHEVPVARLSPGTMLDEGLVVGIDDERAAYELTRHVIAQGHRRIGFVEGIPGHAATGERRDGYARALRGAGIGLCDGLIRPGLFNFESGFAAGLDLLALEDRPSAVIASNDETAAGVMAAAYRNHLRVPTDLSVAGFDDAPLAAALSPPLTTVRQPMTTFGIEAIRMTLAAHTLDAPPLSQRRVIGHEMIVRDTVAPPATAPDGE